MSESSSWRFSLSNSRVDHVTVYCACLEPARPPHGNAALFPEHISTVEPFSPRCWEYMGV